MNWIDTLFYIAVAIALYRGYRSGLVMELCGLIGVVISGFLAYEFCDEVAEVLKIDSLYSSSIAFVVVMVVSVITITLIARLISKILSAAGLGVINNLGGAVLSLLKVLLLLSLLFTIVDAVNSSAHFVSQKSIKESKTFEPTIKVANICFPYIVEFASEWSKSLQEQVSSLGQQSEGLFEDVDDEGEQQNSTEQIEKIIEQSKEGIEEVTEGVTEQVKEQVKEQVTEQI